MYTPIRIFSDDSYCDILPSRGGLATSLTLEKRELLWMPQDFNPSTSSWPGGGIPLCFPVAGRVWHEGMLYRYKVGSAEHHMPLHGFAFASDFTGKTLGKNKARCILSDNQATRVLFPFQFQLTLDYEISARSLLISISVTHTADKNFDQAMPIALGWHPYFLVKDRKSAQVHIPAGKFHPVTPTGAAGKSTDIAELGNMPFSIERPLLNSLIFSQLERGQCSFNPENQQGDIKLTYGPDGVFQHIVVWSNDLDNFYCVEPWMSLPDAIATPSGCRWLKPGETLQGWLKIEVN